MKIPSRINIALCALSGLSSVNAYGNDIKDNDFNPVNTGVTTLSITPDARGSGMGNLGAATDPDINSQFGIPQSMLSPTVEEEWPCLIPRG